MRDAYPGRFGPAQCGAATGPTDTVPHWDQRRRDHVAEGPYRRQRGQHRRAPGGARRARWRLPVGGGVRTGATYCGSVVRTGWRAAPEKYPRPRDGLYDPRGGLLVLDQHAGAAAAEHSGDDDNGGRWGIPPIACGSAVPHVAEGPVGRLFRRRDDRRHRPRTWRPEGPAGDLAQFDDRLRALAARCAPWRARP